jgi:large subunit ribosomal protein L29
MKMQNLSELRDQSPDELKALFGELSKEIFQLRNDFKITKKIEKPHLIKEKKRKRARIMTILREQELKLSQAEGAHGRS